MSLLDNIQNLITITEGAELTNSIITPLKHTLASRLKDVVHGIGRKVSLFKKGYQGYRNMKHDLPWRYAGEDFQKTMKVSLTDPRNSLFGLYDETDAKAHTAAKEALKAHREKMKHFGTFGNDFLNIPNEELRSNTNAFGRATDADINAVKAGFKTAHMFGGADPKDLGLVGAGTGLYGIGMYKATDALNTEIKKQQHKALGIAAGVTGLGAYGAYRGIKKLRQKNDDTKKD